MAAKQQKNYQNHCVCFRDPTAHQTRLFLSRKEGLCILADLFNHLVANFALDNYGRPL